MIDESRALSMTASYCSQGERCLSEVKAKLDKLGVDEEVKGRIISRLMDEEFVDEERYACAFTRDKHLFNGWGQIRIKSELRRKGISDDKISYAWGVLSEENDINSKLPDLLSKKNLSIKDDDPYKRYRKLMQFAIYRGYQYEEIKREIEKLLHTDFEE